MPVQAVQRRGTAGSARLGARHELILSVTAADPGSPPWSSQWNPEGALPGLQGLEEYLQLCRQKTTRRIDGMHEDLRRRPIRKKPDKLATRYLSIAIGRWQQADAMAPIGESAHGLEISRRHRPRDVELDGFLAADQMPFHLVVARLQDDALMLAQILGPRRGSRPSRYSGAATT